MSEENVAVVEQKAAPKPASPRPKRQPPYNVILLDDDEHTYGYVIEMLGKLFGHSLEKAFAMAVEVDLTGRVIGRYDYEGARRTQARPDHVLRHRPIGQPARRLHAGNHRTRPWGRIKRNCIGGKNAAEIARRRW
jgi:ATP-dependent Clp protease adapter protein ClpS